MAWDWTGGVSVTLFILSRAGHGGGATQQPHFGQHCRKGNRKVHTHSGTYSWLQGRLATW